ncbi:MAG: nickel-dependent lactate racemase [Deltaproteobacteria bacterium]|nr:nickel-dependent lactate racemase [Deltaproteobacteria bacterium]
MAERAATSEPIRLPWGGGTLEVRLPASWRVLGELRPRSVAAPPEAAAACAEALREPIGAQRLAERSLAGKRVVIVVDDHTRPTPVAEFLGPILEELSQAGVRDEDLEFLIATGVHRDSRPDEVERKLGAERTTRFRWRCHDAKDPEGLADLGATSRGTHVFLNRRLTEADLIVCAGAVEPHLLLGFGGGLKMLLPGCAGAETIGRNHLQGVGPERFDYVGAEAADSPMRLDLEEGVGLLRKDVFVVNAAMNEQARPTRFFCGDPIRAHRQAAEFVAELAGLEVPEPADVVLANSFPMDADLRQSIKCIGNSLFACKPGGALLGCVYCANGLGEIPIPKRTLPYTLLRTLVRVLGRQRILGLVQKAKKGEPVEEVFVGHFALQMLRRNHLGVFSEKLPAGLDDKMGMARVFDRVGDLVEWAAARVPQRATVWVVPNGGVTFAKPPG